MVVVVVVVLADAHNHFSLAYNDNNGEAPVNKKMLTLITIQ